jgi:sulfur carrier protein
LETEWIFKMKITVNGVPETVDACSVAEFLAEKGLTGDGVVVEHNYRIVKRENWPEARLSENDNLEVLSFVGGG